MSVRQVWVAYFSMGGNGSPDDVDDWLSGATDLPARDHDLIAAALNDEFTALGLNHPMRYLRTASS